MKDDGATQQGVSEDDELTEGEKKEIEEKGRERATSSRLNALDAIAANVNRERVEEDGMELDLETPGGSGEDKAEEGAQGKKSDVGVPGDDELSKEEKEMVKLVVDGTEQEVPLSKVLDAGKRTLQKESVADKRLEEATYLRKTAQQLLDEARKKVQEPARTEKPEDATPALTDDELKTKKKGWIQAIQYGEEEEAEKALDEMIGVMRRGSTTTATTEDIRSLVETSLDEREAKKDQEEKEEIRNRFNAPAEDGGFGDISSSPYLMDEVVKLVDQKIAAGAKGTDWAIYEEAGNEIRKRREEALKPSGKPVVKDELSERRRKKASIDNVKGVGAQGGGKSSTGGAEKTEEESRKEALNDIMRSRGQL